jgi:hypothetical protein
MSDVLDAKEVDVVCLARCRTVDSGEQDACAAGPRPTVTPDIRPIQTRCGRGTAIRGSAAARKHVGRELETSRSGLVALREERADDHRKDERKNHEGVSALERAMWEPVPVVVGGVGKHGSEGFLDFARGSHLGRLVDVGSGVADLDVNG